MVVRGPRLCLRTLAADDAPGVFELGRNPEVSRFFSWQPYTEPSEAADFIAALDHQRAAGERLELGIFRSGGDSPGQASTNCSTTVLPLRNRCSSTK